MRSRSRQIHRGPIQIYRSSTPHTSSPDPSNLLELMILQGFNRRADRIFPKNLGLETLHNPPFPPSQCPSSLLSSITLIIIIHTANTRPHNNTYDIFIRHLYIFHTHTSLLSIPLSSRSKWSRSPPALSLRLVSLRGLWALREYLFFFLCLCLLFDMPDTLLLCYTSVGADLDLDSTTSLSSSTSTSYFVGRAFDYIPTSHDTLGNHIFNNDDNHNVLSFSTTTTYYILDFLHTTLPTHYFITNTTTQDLHHSRRLHTRHQTCLTTLYPVSVTHTHNTHTKTSRTLT